ncbi:MAG: hypothetical protein ACOYOE_11610 [Chlorobium sp.]
MKFCDALRASFFCFVVCCSLFGCSEKKPVLLDKDDVRVAGFYCDYLLLSGVEPRDGGVELTSIDSVDLNELLVRHALSRESITRKIDAYKKNPELWKSVLELVRVNIRHKAATVQ